MVKVLIVDDSALSRRILEDLLHNEQHIEIVGAAIDGRHAIEAVRLLKPDVILMDVEMPELNGIETTKRILASHWVPIILFTGSSQQDSKRVFEGIEAGAVDFLIKPADLLDAKAELLAKIRIAAAAHAVRLGAAQLPAKVRLQRGSSRKLILIGTSTGGPQTLDRLLPEFPENLPAPILIVQHMPPLFTKTLAERLDGICQISVREAQEGDRLEDGVALIAPGGKHMELRLSSAGEPVIHLTNDPTELGVRPCANKLFKTAAPIFKESIIAVVLTGMGRDGTDGAKAIKEVHGTVIAEAEESCVIYGMPKEVINAGYADAVVSIEKMTVALLQLIEQ